MNLASIEQKFDQEQSKRDRAGFSQFKRVVAPFLMPFQEKYGKTKTYGLQSPKKNSEDSEHQKHCGVNSSVGCCTHHFFVAGLKDENQQAAIHIAWYPNSNAELEYVRHIGVTRDYKACLPLVPLVQVTERVARNIGLRMFHQEYLRRGVKNSSILILGAADPERLSEKTTSLLALDRLIDDYVSSKL